MCFHLAAARGAGGGTAPPSALAPVVCNTLIIGWEINAFFLDTPSWVGFVTSAVGVGIGELAACCLLGLLLVALLEKTGLDKRFREL